MIQQAREEIAGELLKVYSTREPVEPLTGRYDGLTVEDAYQIQLLQVTHWLARGARVKGHVGGPEDMIIDIALQLQAERELQAAGNRQGAR